MKLFIALKDTTAQGEGECVGANLANVFYEYFKATDLDIVVISFYIQSIESFYTYNSHIKIIHLSQKQKQKYGLMKIHNKLLWRIVLSYMAEKIIKSHLKHNTKAIVLANEGYFFPFSKSSNVIYMWYLITPSKAIKHIKILNIVIILSRKELWYWYFLGLTAKRSFFIKQSFFRKQAKAAVSQLNTKIVLESSLDSATNEDFNPSLRGDLSPKQSINKYVDYHESANADSHNDERKDTSVASLPQYDKKGADLESNNMDSVPCYETQSISRNDDLYCHTERSEVSIKTNLEFSADSTHPLATSTREGERVENQISPIFRSNATQGWKLVIVGDGGQKPLIESKINELNLQDSVMLKPFTKAIEKEYLSASVYAMSSYFEGFGMVLAEASSYALPCIAFDVATGPSDIIAHSQSGFLVEDNDIEGFAKRLMTLMSDENLRQTMGENAKKLVSEKFSKDLIMKLWSEVINKSTSKQTTQGVFSETNKTNGGGD